MSAVSEIRHVAYAVPGLAAERSFYSEKWGLLQVAEHDGLVYFAAAGSTEPCVVRLREDAERRIDRSEERRVGKEGRSRWSTEHKKNRESRADGRRSDTRNG